MVWDLVNLSDVDNEIIPCKVVELHTDELIEIQPDDVACDIVGYDMIRPIPLTAEILEKNGFEKAMPKIEYYDMLVAGKQLVVEKSPARWYVRYGGCSNYVYKVHELQHALRLCGLTDLADNFKV